MEGGTIIAIILASATGFGTIITQCFHAMSLSRCRKLKCFCMECERDVVSEEILERDMLREDNKPNSVIAD
jgi:hypothetical protein